mmetsp:Transcript_15589/g.26337  ORF Transcript_15589/g.26337 Transcript_15589/m.26337 type:complete len:123 (+) Transcript_15589:713-1081(+)
MNHRHIMIDMTEYEHDVPNFRENQEPSFLQLEAHDFANMFEIPTNYFKVDREEITDHRYKYANETQKEILEEWAVEDQEAQEDVAQEDPGDDEEYEDEEGLNGDPSWPELPEEDPVPMQPSK